MSKRLSTITTVIALAAFMCLGLTGCNTDGMDDGTRKTLGMAIGLMIIAASTLGFMASNRHYGNKRKQNARKNRQRAKQKRRR